jgi:hypothetical protein
MLTILGILALIALMIASLMVLRVKSDPMEKEDVRRYLAESKNASEPAAANDSRPTNSTSPPQP